MNILSLSVNNHESSLTFLKNGKVERHILAERITKRKHEAKIDAAFAFFAKDLREDEYDLLTINIYNCEHLFFKHTDVLKNIFFTLDSKKQATSKNDNFRVTLGKHHLCHAYSGFYSSKFKDALCFVFDGDGSRFFLKEDLIVSEVESIFLFKDEICDNKPIYKKYKLLQETEGVWTNDLIFDYDHDISHEMSIGNKFEFLSIDMGFSYFGAGKLTGLAPYKNYKDRLPAEYNTEYWKGQVDKSYDLHLDSTNKIIQTIDKYTKKTGIKNVVISGGVALNCLINYSLVKHFPDLNFHIDPICSDGGISLGNSLLQYRQETNKIPDRIHNTYFGHKEEFYDLQKFENFPLTKILSHQKTTYDEVANLISQGNLISLFQGRSEVGYRSLGNRSLLFDPRITNGKSIVNRIKKRENFRPFAASILLEEVNDWFDLRTLKESQYMSFAVDAFAHTIETVPAVIHVDGTSRIQTVTKEQNYHFYKLIKAFHSKTNVPMLLNTSFNLANHPLVETLDDAIHTLSNSEIEYLYLPEIQILITLKNER
jgi:carbamoyltransferase